VSVLDPLARLFLPPAVHHALQVAEQIPAAVTAARLALDAGDGPIAALRAFAAATDGQVDDAMVRQIEGALRQAIAVLEGACTMGARLSEAEPAIRAAIDATLAAAFGMAYRAAALQDKLTRWSV
jgi:hypothetical protein